jgi:hypothetical protein
MTRERAVKQRERSALMASAKTATPLEPRLPRTAIDPQRGNHKHFVEQVDASVARRVEALVDMLAWVRIEMAATHPDGVAAPSDHERLQRALVQIEMALAMTKQLATELRRQQRSATGELTPSR